MSHTIYKLEKSEFHRYKLHLLSLDEESRYMRFGYHIKTEQIRDLCNKWRDNADKHIIFAIENSDLEVVGIAHVSLEDTPAELAFSVLKECQGQGMGDALMKRAIEYCQNHGIKTGCMVCLGSNDKIKGLARKHGIKLQTSHGETVADIELEPATPLSVMHEAYVSQLAAFEHFSNMGRKIANLSVFALTLPR